MYSAGLQSGAAGGPAGFLRRLALLLLFAFIAYAVAYHWHDYTPGNNPWNPDGWFLSWDQSQYRKAAINLSEWRFDKTTTYYPPLFPWLGAPFVRWWPDHLYFVPSFLCLVVYLAGLAYIGERYFGRVLTYGVIAVMFIAFPKLTLEQWVIPWTSSGLGALTSILFVLFDRERIDRRTVAVSALVYGAMFATRPLDIVPLAPVAFVIASRALRPFSLRTLLIGIICGLAFPLLWLGLNWHAEGDPFGGYIRISREIGFVAPSMLISHIASIWLSFSTYFPLLVPALALCIVAIFRAPMTIRLVALAVVVNTVAYSAYADLDARNLFTSNFFHYFKWAMPWLALIAAGQAVKVVRPWLAPAAESARAWRTGRNP